MTLTGPQKIPFASQAYYYGDRYPGSAMESNVGVMHTTEGYTLPSYDGGAVAPNVTGVPDLATKTIRWYQHYDVDRSSRALVNASGGVETNTLNAFQIELVGTCDQATYKRWTDAGHWAIYWPGAPDWALAEVAKLVRWLHDNHGFQYRSTVTWKAYPASYGTNNGVRLSGAQWSNYYGWLGHQHVPENLHGDPGNLDMARILALAEGTDSTGGNVALTDDDIKKVGRQVVTGANGMHSPDDPEVEWAVSSYLGLTYKTTRSIATDVAAVKAKVEALTVGGVDLDALAEKVADKLAERLAE